MKAWVTWVVYYLETTPVVIVFVSESGDPIAMTNSPGRTLDESPNWKSNETESQTRLKVQQDWKSNKTESQTRLKVKRAKSD